MNILITGATGFVGNRLLDLFPNDCISVLGRSIPKSFFGVSTIKPINGYEDYSDCLAGIDVVIHLAAVAHENLKTSGDFSGVNVNGAYNLAKQSKDAGVKRFIFISSIGVLGDGNKKPFSEETLESPHSEYAHSKLKAERALQKLSTETGLKLVIIRPVLVYGKNAPGNFGLLTKLVCKLPLTPFGLVNNKRSFISVDNLCNFILLCTSHPKAVGEVFLISDGKSVSTPVFISSIADGLDKYIYHLPVPNFILRFLGSLLGKSKQVGQLIENLEVDCAKARNLLNWTPTETMAQAMFKLK
jgi:nucleoside-diphosphate-sugar epimerase